MLASLKRHLSALHHQARRQAAVLSAHGLQPSPFPEPPRQPRRLLLVLLGLIGDSIMCLPALSEARRLLPGAVIHVLTTGAGEQLLRNSGWADMVHVYNGPAFPLRSDARRSLHQLEERLRLAAPDAAVILLGDDFAPLLCRVGIARRVGVEGSACSALLTHRYPLGDVRAWGPATRVAALRCLGLRPATAAPRLPPPLESGALAVLREQRIAGDSGFLLLHPFGSTPNRTLPLPQAAELAGALADHCRRDVLVIGGPGNRQAAQQIAADCAVPARVHAVAGQFSLPQTLFLMQRAGAIVTTDSGPLHMAGALGRPTVGLFRAIRPEYARLYPTVRPLFWDHGPQCLPGCTWDSWQGCRRSPCRQLAGIPNARVVEAVSQCLARPPLVTMEHRTA